MADVTDRSKNRILNYFILPVEEAIWPALWTVWEYKCLHYVEISRSSRCSYTQFHSGSLLLNFTKSSQFSFEPPLGETASKTSLEESKCRASHIPFVVFQHQFVTTEHLICVFPTLHFVSIFLFSVPRMTYAPLRSTPPPAVTMTVSLSLHVVSPAFPLWGNNESPRLLCSLRSALF